jgi:SulP family sulfate permease
MQHNLYDAIGSENLFGNIDDALNRARELLGLPLRDRPTGAVPEVARERPADIATSAE